MVTTIQIDEKTKILLDKLKIHFRQSYNELINNMAKNALNKKNIMNFAGVWKDIDDNSIDNMKKDIIELRKNSTKELMRI